MKSERWQKVDKLFQAALALDVADRAAFLNHACKGDVALRREVESLLDSHDRAGSFISSPAVEVAAPLFGDGQPYSLIGQSIGPYAVVAPLGAGGMGEVYLAQDTRLGRKAALKMLPDYFTRDEQRLRRFRQEAQAASALNHPYIVTIYDIGESAGRHFIAMEYIDGETLRELIHRDRAPLAKLLGYLRQVAEGLTKAHAAGIVHRDLKPDNIMVTRDGYAKVLDFGLAKLVEPPKLADSTNADASEAATAWMQQASLPGMVMGTIGYMSPEQAQGRTGEIDHRSDIFSFGCILFEAATGRRAFEGKDALDSLHKIVHAPTPQVRAIIPDAPDDLEKIVRRCLAKDPEKRYHSIKDVAIELEELQQEMAGPSPAKRAGASLSERRGEMIGVATDASGPATATTGEIPARPTGSARYFITRLRRHKTAAVLMAVALLIVLGGLSLLLIKSLRGFSQPNQRADVAAPFQNMKLTRLTTSGQADDATISPDGKYVAYINIESDKTASIWIRQVATSRNIKIVEPGQSLARGLTFSPDGNYLYYRTWATRPNKLFRVPVLGGDAQPVVTDIYSPVSFSPDGKQISFVRNHSPVLGDSNVVIANADGTDERIVTTHRMGVQFANPSRPTAPVWSPDGKVLACALASFGGPVSLLEVQVASGAERQIGTQQWAFIDRIAWLPDGSGLMLTSRNHLSPQTQVWFVAYPSGEARRVTNDLNDYRGMSLTADAKALVVVQTSRQSNLYLAPSGKPSEARPLTTGVGKDDGYWGISWTPDGNLVYASNASGNRDLWLMDVARGTPKQLTSEARQNYYPTVTPDGRAVMFVSNRGETLGLWRMDMDGSNLRQLVASPLQADTACSSDSKWVIYSSISNKGIPALWKMSVDGGEPVLLNDEHWNELPVVSPDGQRVLFQYFFLNEKGVFIGQVPLEGGPAEKIAESPFRFVAPIALTPDGSAIAYLDKQGGATNIYALPLGGGPPKQLTDFKGDHVFWFEWSPDGKQLALARGTQTSDVVLISNFK